MFLSRVARAPSPGANSRVKGQGIEKSGERGISSECQKRCCSA